MKANVGGIDQILRIIVGIALVVAVGTGLLGAWAWVGVIPLATGLMRFCPLYPILGISTCSKK
jgi:hypothetical protein